MQKIVLFAILFLNIFLSGSSCGFAFCTDSNSEISSSSKHVELVSNASHHSKKSTGTDKTDNANHNCPVCHAHHGLVATIKSTSMPVFDPKNVVTEFFYYVSYLSLPNAPIFRPPIA